MQRIKPWRSALLCGLFCLLLAFSVLNCGIGASDPMDADYGNMITDHKNGTPSENCTIANNIVYRSIDASGTDVTEHHNYIVGADNSNLLYNLFISPDDFDFHLLDNTLTREKVIDQGEVFVDRISSEIDRDNVERTGAPDLGAYENNG
jgi:hypothetical protein